ncbi:uncharacterized protein LOC133730623 [Rosa rugosa]|uniref:uncharacterized protein LOC133730623 n=1 Tax=Rosa rugosa TaxID=74645 RepID=UPI002B408FC1|nr:uncharacterized protein LOC133730623 [Rosa rugosa]
MWKADTPVRLRTYGPHHIDAEIGQLGTQEIWRFTGIYGFAHHSQRHRTWNLIKTLVAQPCSLPWIMAGGFNEIMSNNEKSGGVPRAWAPMQSFRQTMVDCDLHDMGYVGSRYTWSNKTKERLDRSFASPKWRDLFPCSRVVTLSLIESDHTPLLVEVSAERRIVWRAPKRFRFEEMWDGHADCLSVIQRGWSQPLAGNGMLQVSMKIGKTGQELMHWHQHVFDAQRGEMRVIQKKLNDLMRQPFTPDQYKEQRALHAKLSTLLTQQETYWRQRSKALWLKEWDMNSAFFHRRASNRKAKNRIKGVNNGNGTWCSDPREIHDIILQYFQGIYAS